MLNGRLTRPRKLLTELRRRMSLKRDEFNSVGCSEERAKPYER